MNYCIKCGNRLNKNNNFCSKCGNKIMAETNKKTKNNKDEKKEKLLLLIGTILIIVSSIIFAVANWNEMTSIIKILFLVIESLLFLSLSIFSKKLEYKTPYKFLWFIGITFIPLILFVIAKDGLLGKYLSFDGSGIHVYLAISSFICFILYFFSHRFLKSNVFLFISFIFMYFGFINILGIFKLDTFEMAIPILNVLNLILCLLHLIIKNKNYKRVTNIFIGIILFIFSILTFIYSFIDLNYILHSITYVSIITTLILLIFKSKRNILIYIYPFIIYILLVAASLTIFAKYENVILFMSLLSIILVNFIINIKDNNVLKNISYILMLLFNMFILINFNVSYITLCICSVVLLLVSIFILKLNDQKVQVNISKILIPVYIFIIIYSLIKIFLNIDLSIIYMISSLICFTLFVIFNIKMKDKSLKSSFEVYSYLYLIVSGMIILFNYPSIISFILNEILWIYYFTFNKFIKRNKAICVWLLIMLIINFILLSIRYSVSIYYSLLFISLITLLLDFIEIKVNKKNTIYIYFSLIATSLACLFNLSSIAIIGVGILVLSYIFTYFVYNKYHKTKFIFKFFYTILGFVLINSVFNYFLNKDLLINILVLVIYLIIIISMFLLEVDSDRRVLSYSIVVIYPYLKILDLLNLSDSISTSLVVLLLLILTLIYFEKVFNLKENDKIIFELLLLGLIHLITIPQLLLFNFILAAFYIFYGFYKKRESFTIFGTILLFINLLINIFRIYNNIAVTYVMLIVGVIMFGYVFYMEAKKKN